MPIKIVVPEMGESVIDATVLRWLKREGDRVAVGESLVELETDKINLEVGAEHAGVLVRIETQQGQDVKPGDVLGLIEETAEAMEAPRIPETAPPAVQEAMPAGMPTAPAEAAPVQQPPRIELEDREERVRMSRRRQTIARRLVEAQRTAAMLTTFNEIDMSAVNDVRTRHRESFRAKYGVSLGIMPFFIHAAIVALKAVPRLNAEIQGDEMVLKRHHDIGIAIAASDGLVVPVLRDADRMSFAGIERAIEVFVRKAADGTLSLDELRGGTFTITNGGVFGSLLSTPILNPPQVGILGLHRIHDRPVARNGEVVIRAMMYIALSYDHRLVDGREAVQFLVRLKELIEDPAAWLLEA